MKGTKIGTPLKNDVYQKPMYIAWMYLNGTYTFVHEDKGQIQSSVEWAECKAKHGDILFTIQVSLKKGE